MKWAALLVALLLLYAASRPSPVRLSVRPQAVFAGQQVLINVHVALDDSDRWIALTWEPDTVGDSVWPVDPAGRSTWQFTRRLEVPGTYHLRALVGHGQTVRAVASQTIEVLGN